MDTLLRDQQIEKNLKEEIIEIATALYGSPSSPAKTLAVMSFLEPLADGGEPRFGAQLIKYTSPNSFAKWEILLIVKGYSEAVFAMAELARVVRTTLGEFLNSNHVREGNKVDNTPWENAN